VEIKEEYFIIMALMLQFPKLRFPKLIRLAVSSQNNQKILKEKPYLIWSSGKDSALILAKPYRIEIAVY
jgi:hypothetical protein